MLNYIRVVVFSLKNTNTLARPCVYIDNRPVIWVKAGNLRPSARGTPAATITMGGIRSELSLLHYRCCYLATLLSKTKVKRTPFEQHIIGALINAKCVNKYVKCWQSVIKNA